MSDSEGRYNQNNFHIIISDSMSLFYDVPSNTLFKVSHDLAQKAIKLRTESYKLFELFMDEKLSSKNVTIPSHNYWWMSKSINKLIFNVTSYCNLRCKYCYANFGAFSDYDLCNMLPDDSIKYINSLIHMGIYHIDTVQFFGGEPLLAINTIETICKHLTLLFKQKKIDSIPVFNMITNCVIIDDKINSIIKSYNIRLTVSLDGPQEIHDLQRVFSDGKGTYSCVSSNMHILKEQIDAIEVTYTKHHAENNISFNELKEYFNNIFGVSKNKVLIVPVTGVPELEVQPHVLEYYKDDNSFTAEDTYLLSVYYPEKQSDLFCTTGFNSLCIMPNGDVYPCHMYATNRDYCLGNILKEFDFSYIKNRLDTLPLGNKLTREDCSICWARKVCQLCPAKTIISKKTENDIINESSCNSRRKMIENKLLKIIYN